MTQVASYVTAFPMAALLSLSLAVAGCSSPRTAFDPGELTVLLDASGVAIKGFDPVAYFARDEAVPGDPAFTAEYAGATYRFATQANHDAFVVDPERFAPAYGGWCAWAMADDRGSLVEVDPESFLIEDGRLLLFYDTWLADTRAMWLRRDREELHERADRNWNRLSSQVQSSGDESSAPGN